MLEIKMTIEAPELAQSINNLAAALCGAKPLIQQAAPAAAGPAAQENPTPAVQPATVVPNAAPVVPASAPAGSYPSNQSVSAPVAAPAAQPPAPTGVPVAPPEQYTADQIMKAGAVLMDAGRVSELVNLLHSFGVNAVTELKPEQLGAFATALRSMGAKI